jgi:hypothetical protein
MLCAWQFWFTINHPLKGKEPPPPGFLESFLNFSRNVTLEAKKGGFSVSTAQDRAKADNPIPPDIHTTTTII